MKPFMNLDEIPESEYHQSERGQFGERYAAISEHIGARLLSYSVTILPPGKRVCPFHNHRINEELFLVLDGEGTLRFGDERYPIKQHDIIACPPGGPEVAHQIINTSDREMRYLCLSTAKPYDICEYPDSDKINAFVGGGEGKGMRHVSRRGDAVDYYDGEE